MHVPAYYGGSDYFRPYSDYFNCIYGKTFVVFNRHSDSRYQN